MTDYEEFEARAMEAIVAANARIDNCHEEISCPTCWAPVGQRCRSMPRGYRPLDPVGRARVLRTPHKARWHQVVAPR